MSQHPPDRITSLLNEIDPVKAVGTVNQTPSGELRLSLYLNGLLGVDVDDLKEAGLEDPRIIGLYPGIGEDIKLHVAIGYRGYWL